MQPWWARNSRSFFFIFFSHVNFFCILDEISLLEDPRWIWTQLFWFGHILYLQQGFWRSSYIYHAFREVDCRNDAHNPVSPLALFVQLQHVLLQARLLCTLWTFRNAIHTSCKSTTMTRRSCFAQRPFCRSIHVSQKTLAFHPGVSCLLRHRDFSRCVVLSCYFFAIVFASVAQFHLATASLPQFLILLWNLCFSSVFDHRAMPPRSKATKNGIFKKSLFYGEIIDFLNFN